MKPRTQDPSKSRKKYKSPFLSDYAVNLIQRYTVARTRIGSGLFMPYRTIEGQYLIGYGSKILRNRPIYFTVRGTEEEINEQLVKDLEELGEQLSGQIVMPLNTKKRAAILSYAHSIGFPAFKECKLLELINKKASRSSIIREWSPFINTKYRGASSMLIQRRRVELNWYVAPDDQVPLFFKHNCKMKQCLLNIGESYLGTPSQVKAVEYLERKLIEWDSNGEVLRRFWLLWNQVPSGLDSFRSL